MHTIDDDEFGVSPGFVETDGVGPCRIGVRGDIRT